MHIAAVAPRVVRGDDMPAEVLAKEEEIVRASARHGWQACRNR